MSKHKSNRHLFLPYSVMLLYCFSFFVGICQSQETPNIHLSTLHGQITDKQDNPLSEYTVSAVSQADNITYATKTDSGGQFELTNLSAGIWEMEVRYDSTLIAEREVTVAEKSVVKTEFVVAGTGVISGFLLDSINKHPLPITGEIQVGLLIPETQRISHVYRGKINSGYFEVKNLLPGHYTIIDSFKGYVFATSNLTPIIVYPQNRVGGREILLKPGASLHGRFVSADNQHPITGVSVMVVSEKSNRIHHYGEYNHKIETDTKGEFHLTIPNDSDIYYAFTLIALHPRFQTHRWKWEMSPEKNVYDLGDLLLQPYLSLQGKVSVSNAHYTRNGLKVRLKMHNKPVDFFRTASQIEKTVQTDAEGNFTFSELYPIEYSLTISRNDLVIAFLDSVYPQNKKLLNIQMPKLKTLHGKVVDTQGRFIPNAQLRTTRHSEIRSGHRADISSTKTDVNGNFQMQVLDTKPHLLSVDVSKKGYLARVYRNVKIGKEPLVVPLEKGFAIKGRVILPRDVPPDGYYEVKVFPEKAKMEPTLNPLTLNKPLMFKRFPVTETSFVLDGLFEEKYKLYIMGDNIAASETEVKPSANGDVSLIVADRATVDLKGQVLWAATGKPVQNALVSRSWYPWELSPYDMSMTLDRFETETDAQGNFTFSNLTQEQYQLLIRVVQTVFEKETETYQRIQIHKQVTLPAGSDEIYPIYLGKADGTSFSR